MRVKEGEALGRWLGVVSRAVVGAVSGEGGDREGGSGKRERGENGDGNGGVGDEEGEGDGDGDGDVGDWNVVQNNGAFVCFVSSQLYLSIHPSTSYTQEPNPPSIPSPHFPPTKNRSFSQTSNFPPTHSNPTGARAAQVVPHVHFHIIPRVGDDVPEVKARSWTVFGKGQREELDEEDAVVLVRRMRERLRGEVERVRRREGEGAVRGLFGVGGGDGDEDWRGRGKGKGSKL